MEYHQKRAARAEEKGEAYELTSEQCAELQQEGIQYYHRYLSLFQVNDFAGVVRDTQRNLDLFTFVTEHTDRGAFLELATVPAVRAHDEYARQGLHFSRSGEIC